LRAHLWLLAGIVGLAPILAPRAGSACDDVNVLVNPGGESGPPPWDYVNTGSRHQVGAVMLSTGTIEATEGTAWFAGERIETAVSIGTAPLRVEQSVDIRGPRPVDCIRLDADYFGVGEILEGAGTLEEIITVRIDFYDDSSPNPIGFASEIFGPFSLATPFEVLGLRVETTDIPAGAAFAVARMQGQMNLNSAVGGVPATGHVILGADNAVMSVTLPEPDTRLLGLTVCIALVGISRRAGRAVSCASCGPHLVSRRRPRSSSKWKRSSPSSS